MTSRVLPSWASGRWAAPTGVQDPARFPWSFSGASDGPGGLSPRPGFSLLPAAGPPTLRGMLTAVLCCSAADLPLGSAPARPSAGSPRVTEGRPHTWAPQTRCPLLLRTSSQGLGSGPRSRGGALSVSLVLGDPGQPLLRPGRGRRWRLAAGGHIVRLQQTRVEPNRDEPRASRVRFSSGSQRSHVEAALRRGGFWGRHPPAAVLRARAGWAPRFSWDTHFSRGDALGLGALEEGPSSGLLRVWGRVSGARPSPREEPLLCLRNVPAAPPTAHRRPGCPAAGVCGLWSRVLSRRDASLRVGPRGRACASGVLRPVCSPPRPQRVARVAQSLRDVTKCSFIV